MVRKKKAPQGPQGLKGSGNSSGPSWSPNVAFHSCCSRHPSHTTLIPLHPPSALLVIPIHSSLILFPPTLIALIDLIPFIALLSL